MLEAKLFSIFVRYYFAVLYGDTSAVKSVLSKVRVAAFADEASAQKKTDEEILRAFVDKQQKKIQRIDYRSGGSHYLSSVGVSDSDGAIALLVVFGDEEMSKPIYFVKEEGEYKLSIIHPYSSSRYRVKNDHSQTHRVKCKGGSRQDIPPGTERYMTCEDDCVIFSGSWFKDEDTERRVKCDYNTYGWDVRFNESGTLECHDNC